MTTALATLNRYRKVIVIDVVLVTALYLLPSLSHMAALPLYKLEPMRLALLVALLFTNRTNTFLLALTIPLASSWITGHPEPLKALLIGIELTVLSAGYFFLNETKRLPALLAMLVAILLGKAVYYGLKYILLSAGLLNGTLVSTPVASQLVLAALTALIFGAIEANRRKAESP